MLKDWAIHSNSRRLDEGVKVSTTLCVRLGGAAQKAGGHPPPPL